MTGQMKKLTGKCPVTDCYCEHCYIQTYCILPGLLTIEEEATKQATESKMHVTFLQ